MCNIQLNEKQDIPTLLHTEGIVIERIGLKPYNYSLKNINDTNDTAPIVVMQDIFKRYVDAWTKLASL